MSTPTPKRKRGQHAKRHPLSNAARELPDKAMRDAWSNWVMEKRPLDDDYDAFMAGYRAGKDAK